MSNEETNKFRVHKQRSFPIHSYELKSVYTGHSIRIKLSSGDCTYTEDESTFKENDTKQETKQSQQLYKLEQGSLTIQLVRSDQQNSSQEFIFRPVVNYFLTRQKHKEERDSMFGYVKTVKHLLRSNTQTINIAAALKGYNDNTGTVEVEMIDTSRKDITIEKLALNLHK